MLLSDREIRKLAEDPAIRLLSPFSEDQLQGASYDVSLSGNLALLKNTGAVIDPFSAQSVDEQYEMVTIGEEGYLFCPGEYVLAELRERIRIPQTLCAHIRPRTRFTRSGILIADQHCNPTYEGILQIGIFHAGRSPFLLRTGLRMAQLVFEELKSAPSEEKLYQNKKNAAYSGEEQFRGSRFGEVSWSAEGQRLYQDILASLRKST